MPSHRAPLALLLHFAAASAAAGQASFSQEAMHLGPGDLVRVEAFLARSASDSVGIGAAGAGEYMVDVQGFALLPLVGMLQVAGRPFQQVRIAIEEAYAREFVDARVRVTPLVRIALLGEVRLPGLLPVDPTMTLADVVAAAGGLNPTADRRDIRLVRGDETVVVAAERELAALTVPLRSGDRIVVGRRSWLSENLPFVLGAGASVVAAVLTAVIVR
jgi:polysaccharide export outer membrane protein